MGCLSITRIGAEQLHVGRRFSVTIRKLIDVSDWMLLAAATVTDPSTRNSMISKVHNYVSSSRNSAPFPAMYDPSTGSAMDGANAGYNR